DKKLLLMFLSLALKLNFPVNGAVIPSPPAINEPVDGHPDVSLVVINVDGIDSNVKSEPRRSLKFSSGGNATSTAPISQIALPSLLPSGGRGMRRWSLSSQAAPPLPGVAGLPLSIAGLSESSTWVTVGPSLFARGPRRGARPVMEVPPLIMQLLVVWI